MRSETNVVRFNVPPLPAGQTWRPQNWLDRFGGDELIRRVRAEAKAHAAGALTLEESEFNDGTGVVTVTTLAVPANETKATPWLPLTRQYYRLTYTNGGTAQPVDQRMHLLMETGGGPVAPSPNGNQMMEDVVFDAATSTRTTVGTGTGATATLLLPANPLRRYLLIQAVGTAAVTFKLGANCTAATATGILKAGAAANDGNGGSFAFKGYTGPVTAFGSASTEVLVTEA